MAATATKARRTAARKPAASRSAARSAPRRAGGAGRPAAKASSARSAAGARQTTGWLVPVAAVGRTAVAVGGLADSGLVYRLTRGRLWIGLLATLLIGIVGLNVVALSFSASASKAARDADELKRLNSAARAQLASQLSSDELRSVAERLGLVVPPPDRIRYLKPSSDDAAKAAQRIRSGELTAAPAAPVITETVATEPVVPVEETTAVDPAAPIVSDPATTTDPAMPPVAPPATTTASTETTTVAPPAGGVTAP